ncbi:MAG: hypothetical protein JXR76_17610 [Deltaproteobacteria bacterium]|nr:hypothetical protein [Deltaproteobacteria bacterium]
MNRYGCNFFFLSLVWTVLLSTAFSIPAHAFVHSDSCTQLNTELIRQLATIELQAPEEPPLQMEGMRVELMCDADTDDVRISVWDPVTQKQMQRTVKIAAAQATERAIALVISQLYKASWSELLISSEETAPVSAASPTDVVTATTVARRTFLDKPNTWNVSIGAGMRRRFAGIEKNGLHTQLGLGRILKERWIPGIYVQFDMGEPEVQLGAVQFFNWAVGAECAIQFRPLSRLAINAGIAAAATWSILAGRVDRDGLVNSTTSGISGEGILFAGPALRLGDLFFRLQIDAGYAIKNPIAHVGNGETFTLGGFFLGISLRIFYGFSKD